MDDSLHKSYTGVERTHNDRFLRYLQEIGKPVWARHVVVPGITDRDDRLEAVAQYLKQFSVIERVEVLGYHTMGEYKYESLGLPYPLHGVEPLSPERKANAKAIFQAALPDVVVQ